MESTPGEIPKSKSVKLAPYHRLFAPVQDSRSCAPAVTARVANGGVVGFCTEELREGLDKNVKTATQAALGKMDLVTREEFDIQCKLLTRSRQRLEDLSQQLDEIEKKLDKLQQ